jgi:hypothetical protein
MICERGTCYPQQQWAVRGGEAIRDGRDQLASQAQPLICGNAETWVTGLALYDPACMAHKKRLSCTQPGPNSQPKLEHKARCPESGKVRTPKEAQAVN